MTLLTLVAPVSKNYAIQDFCESICAEPHNLQTVLDLVGNSPVLMGKRTYEKVGNLFTGEQILFTYDLAKMPSNIPVTHSIKDAINYFDISPNLFCLGEEDIYSTTINRSKILEVIRSDICAINPATTLDLKHWNLTKERWKKENPRFSHITYERKPEEETK